MTHLLLDHTDVTSCQCDTSDPIMLLGIVQELLF